MERFFHKYADEIIDLLESGKVIDAFKYPEYFSALDNEGALEQINKSNEIRKTECLKTSDGKGFYLRTLDEKKALSAAESMIKEVVKYIRPLVEWLQLTRIISRDGLAMTTGTTITKESLLRRLDQPQPRSMMNELANKFSTKGEVISEDSTKHLQTVMDFLEKNDYVMKVDSGLAYVGLAKWSLVEEVMRYLARTNDLPAPEDMEQGELI